ncbi:unnamed protein product [Rhizoctonia solani]|uniref:Semialdehyde dehydrogenase NAD-binding domain-containing protein n=1 Tax=Rhizoctonia solani TaxID=456999 RepID=A0A8H3D5T6_9AGAM|nr:unnamed protein product [Rhizoctonia solani]CAE6514164.1 unnamed protein product [Rhizoctonia solani]
MPANRVFILGATGYIGGAVLSELRRNHPKDTFTALARKDEDIQALEKIGVKGIKGTFLDIDKIEQESRQADIVINAADADDMGLVKAIIKGLKSKKERGVLIQTSGTGLLNNNYNGELRPEDSKIWNDNDINDIAGIPPEAHHRDVDLEIFAAHERGDVDAYIIAPSCIYGVGDGPVKRISQQIPVMINISIKHKQAVYVGKGTNVWGNVHINDLVKLYELVLQHAISVRDGQTPRPAKFENFYFGSAGEHVWGDIAKQLGPLLHQKGKADTPEARSITADEMKWPAVATNSRSVAERSRSLGWNPTAKSVHETLEEDLDAVLATLN